MRVLLAIICVVGVEMVVGPIDSMVAPNGAAVVVLVVVTGIAVEQAIANGFEVAAPRYFEEDAVVAAPMRFEEVGIWAIPMDSELVAV